MLLEHSTAISRHLRIALWTKSSMTACSNGLIDESRYELDKDGKLVIYYKASQEGIDTINNYIKD